MYQTPFPVIDPAATGRNILRLRKERGLTVKDLQAWFGFEEPQAIYKWQRGESIPCVDNLYALGILFNVPMDAILITRTPNAKTTEQQATACCSCSLFRLRWVLQTVDSHSFWMGSGLSSSPEHNRLPFFHLSKSPASGNPATSNRSIFSKERGEVRETHRMDGRKMEVWT